MSEKSANTESKTKQDRRKTGKHLFQKGQSGNPGGRPKLVGHVRELAQAQTADAINTLVKIMADDSAPPASRVSAAQALLDRGWGKAAQPIEGADGQALFPTVVEVVLRHA